MSPDREGLYQQLILDHAKSPRGRALLESPSGRSHQVNPTCGDEVTLTVRVEKGVVRAVGWEGRGCSISQASASLLSTLLEDVTLEDAAMLLEKFREAMRSRGQVELDEITFGDAIALNGVSRYVARVRCAMLPWVALEDALSL